VAFFLDVKDKKILTLLDENARLSNSEIAHKIGLSKPAVEYRIQRFAKHNIILSYYTLLDFTRLGYAQYKMYFKLQNTTVEKEEEIIRYWINSTSAIWVAQLRGKWDLTVSILARTNYEFGRVITEFMNKYSVYILEKELFLMEYSNSHMEHRGIWCN
jgi:Lrp/AsnC family leucine-responsive transcriptional regulator